MTSDKQLERVGMRRRGRAACAPFDFAHALTHRWSPREGPYRDAGLLFLKFAGWDCLSERFTNHGCLFMTPNPAFERPRVSVRGSAIIFCARAAQRERQPS